MAEKKDYSRFVEDAPSDEQVSSLSAMVARMHLAETLVEKLDADLRDAKARLREIAEREIPEKMEELGLETFKTSSGVGIKVDNKLQVTPKKDDREWVLDWLEETGQQALVKRTVTAALNAGEGEKAEAIRAAIEAIGADIKVERKVEPSTLKKHVKTLLEAGAELPMDRLGIFQYKCAKITDRAPDPVFNGE